MTNPPTNPHISVLMNEFLNFFSDKQLRYFLDGTLGAGGHAEAILKQHPEIEVFIGIDQDPEALQIAEQRLTPWKSKIKIFRGNFDRLKEYAQEANVQAFDGMFFDLGVSSMQLDRPEKGFSFMREGPLDMRMDPEGELTAFEVVNFYDERDLGIIFRDYGEEKKWRVAAKAIVTARAQAPINTTIELANVLKPVFPWHKKGINPLTLIFQGLRIYVNRELEVIKKMIPAGIDLLAPKGRLGVISFHSLEDRLVKNAFSFGASDKYDTSGWGGVFLDKEPVVQILTRKPICASEEEVARNPRSRSAKLRFIEKL